MVELFHKKRRGVVRAFLIKLGTKLTVMEANRYSPNLLESTSNLADKLNVAIRVPKSSFLCIYKCVAKIYNP